MKSKDKRFIPICCVCENVRDDRSAPGAEPEWGPLISYLETHRLSSGDYDLTHTYCPACARQFIKLRRAHSPEPLTEIPVSEHVMASQQPEFAGETTTV